MLRDTFANPNLYGVIATVAFFALFLGVAVYLATDRRRRHHERMQNLPLEDDRHG